jgi:hypothetical protein
MGEKGKDGFLEVCIVENVISKEDFGIKKTCTRWYLKEVISNSPSLFFMNYRSDQAG